MDSFSCGDIIPLSLVDRIIPLQKTRLRFWAYCLASANVRGIRFWDIYGAPRLHQTTLEVFRVVFPELQASLNLTKAGFSTYLSKQLTDTGLELCLAIGSPWQCSHALVELTLVSSNRLYRLPNPSIHWSLCSAQKIKGPDRD